MMQDTEERFWELANVNANGQRLDEEYRRLCMLPVVDYFDLLSNLSRIKHREAQELKKARNG